MLTTLRNAWKIADLRKKILFTMLIILLYRIGNAVPVPFVNVENMSRMFDEQLSGGIRKLERLYITFFVFIIGLVTIASMGAMNEWDSVIVLLGILAWILVDCLLISPLIYFAVMPKPVRKHIKDIDKLTPYEQKVREAERGRNERAEKILKKYKNSGRYTGL